MFSQLHDHTHTHTQPYWIQCLVFLLFPVFMDNLLELLSHPWNKKKNKEEGGGGVGKKNKKNWFSLHQHSIDLSVALHVWVGPWEVFLWPQWLVEWCLLQTNRLWRAHRSKFPSCSEEPVRNSHPCPRILLIPSWPIPWCSLSFGCRGCYRCPIWDWSCQFLILCILTSLWVF